MSTVKAITNTRLNTLSSDSDFGAGFNATDLSTTGATAPASPGSFESLEVDDVQKASTFDASGTEALLTSASDQIGGSAGPLRSDKMGLPEISGDFWSIMEGVGLRGRVPESQMEFESTAELTGIKDALTGVDAVSLLAQAGAAMPDITLVGKDGASNTYFGEPPEAWGFVGEVESW